MQFAFVGYDKPNNLQRRLDARPDHLKHLESLGEKLLLAGPFLDEKGDMCGTILILEAETYEDAKSTFDRDPFMRAGVFDSVTIKPYRIGINNTKKA